MKSLRFVPLVLATLCTFPLAAQQPDAPQPQQQPGTQQTPPSQPAQAAPARPAEPEALSLSPVTAELTSKLDSKSAKAGDSVVLKTTENATMADGTVIPKGSKIVGHVTEAQPYVANSDNGRVTLQFDQAQLKSGQSMPIKSAIQTITPAGGSTADSVSSMPAGGGSAAPAPSGGASPGGAGSAAGSAPARSTQSAPSPGMTDSAGASSGGPAPGTTVARNGNVVIKTSAVPGVLVASSVNGQPFSNASGALLSARQDVHLDGGTKMVLALATSSAPGAPR
jgi:hypothetical protein